MGGVSTRPAISTLGELRAAGYTSRTLREELRPWGVNVTCLAPGAVATDLYDRSGGAARTAARFGVLKDPERVAAAALRGMFRRKAMVLPGMGARLMAAGSAATPGWLIRFARTHTGLLPLPDDRADG